MSLTDKLDYTPNFTVSTLQFRSEPLNVIVSSALAVLILVNIGSAVSKLVYFTRRTNFHYGSWVRSFIFANSDDPVRIISWLLRRYAYRDPKWIRARNHLRPSRLVVPLLARFTILIASIASVAITIPGEKNMPRCQNGDYRPIWDISKARFTSLSSSVCIDLDMDSTLGIVRSTASYCNCPFYTPANFEPGLTVISVLNQPSVGIVSTFIGNRDAIVGNQFYFEWRTVKNSSVAYRSDTSSLDIQTHSDIIIRALQAGRDDCGIVEQNQNDTDISTAILTTLSCDQPELSTLNGRVESIIRNALVWQRSPNKQPRLIVQDGIISKDVPGGECPIQVTVTRPIVNILPLAISLVLWFLVNLLVSFAVSKHGNALDAAFHLIKEILGHDCTSNPIEVNLGRNEVIALDLYKWQCASSGGGHVGFLRGEGDVPVHEFDGSVVVGGCGHTAASLARTQELCNRLRPSPSVPATSASVTLAPATSTPAVSLPVTSIPTLSTPPAQPPMSPQLTSPPPSSPNPSSPPPARSTTGRY